MVGDSHGTAVTRTTLYSGEAGEAGEAGDAGDAGEAGEAGDAGEADEPPSQPHIGRYVVLRPLGRGGMGVVYLAYDDLLDRKVALKLIHTAGGSHTDGTARLLREAHALARLSHPNVVQIYEVGQHGQQVYLAMENLRGVTLRAWGETPRSWRAVLAVYRQAAAGLAAAHAAGLVHRDFKPKYRRLSQTAPQPTDRPHSHELGRFERVSLLRLAPRCPALPQVLAKSWQRVGPRGRCSRAATMRQ